MPECAKVVRRWCAFHLLTSTCVSRHSTMHFFHIITTSTSAPNILWYRLLCTFWLPNVLRTHNHGLFFCFPLPRWLRTRCFSEPTFRPQPPERQIDPPLRGFPNFSRMLIFVILIFSLFRFFVSSLLWLFPRLLPHLSTLSKVWLLHFLRQGRKKCALGNGVLLLEAVWGLCVPGLIRRLQSSIQSVIRSSTRSCSFFCSATTLLLCTPGRPIDRCWECPKLAACCT